MNKCKSCHWLRFIRQSIIIYVLSSFQRIKLCFYFSCLEFFPAGFYTEIVNVPSNVFSGKVWQKFHIKIYAEKYTTYNHQLRLSTAKYKSNIYFASVSDGFSKKVWLSLALFLFRFLCETVPALLFYRVNAVLLFLMAALVDFIREV